MPMRLLITRPAEDARELADRLQALGHETTIEPMLTIAPVPYSFPDAPIAAIVLTSRHGARMIAGEFTRHLANVPGYCVGKATAEAARIAGFKHVMDGGGNAAALTAAVSGAFDSDNGVVLHARGRHTRGDIAGKLRRQGFDAREVIVYEAIATPELSLRARKAITSHALDGIVFLSPRTAQIFAVLVNNAGLTPALAGLDAYCLSDAVAAPLAGLSMNDAIAGQPSLSALLDLLEHRPAASP